MRTDVKSQPDAVTSIVRQLTNAILNYVATQTPLENLNAVRDLLSTYLPILKQYVVELVINYTAVVESSLC